MQGKKGDISLLPRGSPRSKVLPMGPQVLHDSQQHLLPRRPRQGPEEKGEQGRVHLRCVRWGCVREKFSPDKDTY